MACPGDALIVDADGITINLNGHAVTGAAAGNGITVRARYHVTIHGGTVAGFLTGRFAGNVCALQGAAAGNTLSGNVLVRNTTNAC